MSFKFRLGEIVVPMKGEHCAELPSQPSKVVALQLRGYIVVNPLGTVYRLLVKEHDYERFEEEIIELDH